MATLNCPNCNTPYEFGDETCSNCGFTFPYSTSVLPDGTLLRGKYEVQELVHSGGMGYVYLAKDKNLFDRLCVIKQVKDRIQSEEHQEKLEEEAQRMSKLNHPNVAMILDHFVEKGFYFLVVEYIRGKTLSQLYEEGGKPLQESEVVSWATKICDVLIYLHSEGIIHRDVSPDNIMLNSDGVIKFIDFGTLRELRNVNINGTAGMGKFGYTPPEQWQGKPEPRSDIFALGATLYYLLTGFTPRSREYQAGQGPQRTDFYPEFPSVRNLNKFISPQFENILKMALQLEIDNRYSSAEDMKRDIEYLRLHNPTRKGRNIQSIRVLTSRRFTIAVSIIVILGTIGGIAYYTKSHADKNLTYIDAQNMSINGINTTDEIIGESNTISDGNKTIALSFNNNYEYFIYEDSFDNNSISGYRYWQSSIYNDPTDSANPILHPVCKLQDAISFDYQYSSIRDSYNPNPPTWTFFDVAEEQSAEVNIGLYTTKINFIPGFNVKRTIDPQEIHGNPSSKITLVLRVTVIPQPGNDDAQLMDISINTWEDYYVIPTVIDAVYRVPSEEIVDYFNVRSNGLDLGVNKILNGFRYEVIVTLNLILKDTFSSLTYIPQVVIARGRSVDNGMEKSNTMSHEVKGVGTWTWSVANEECIWHWDESVSTRLTLRPRTNVLLSNNQ